MIVCVSHSEFSLLNEWVELQWRVWRTNHKHTQNHNQCTAFTGKTTRRDHEKQHRFWTQTHTIKYSTEGLRDDCADSIIHTHTHTWSSFLRSALTFISLMWTLDHQWTSMTVREHLTPSHNPNHSKKITEYREVNKNELIWSSLRQNWEIRPLVLSSEMNFFCFYHSNTETHSWMNKKSHTRCLLCLIRLS